MVTLVMQQPNTFLLSVRDDFVPKAFVEAVISATCHAHCSFLVEESMTKDWSRFIATLQGAYRRYIRALCTQFTDL